MLPPAWWPRSRLAITAHDSMGRPSCGGQQVGTGIAPSPSAVRTVLVCESPSRPGRRLPALLPYRAPRRCPSTLAVVQQRLKQPEPPSAIPTLKVSRPLDWDHPLRPAQLAGCALCTRWHAQDARAAGQRRPRGRLAPRRRLAACRRRSKVPPRLRPSRPTGRACRRARPVLSRPGWQAWRGRRCTTPRRR